MTLSPKGHHRVFVETDVFAALWRERKPGEESENDILRRMYGLDDAAGRKPDLSRDVAVETASTTEDTPASKIAPTSQQHVAASAKAPIVHHEANTDLPQGFEIFREFKGRAYRAQVVAGGWRLENESAVYRSLKALNGAIGASESNEWMAWKFRDSANKRQFLDEYRLGKR